MVKANQEFRKKKKENVRVEKLRQVACSLSLLPKFIDQHSMFSPISRSCPAPTRAHSDHFCSFPTHSSKFQFHLFIHSLFQWEALLTF